MNVQQRIEQTTGKIQRYYQDTDTVVVPLPPTIIVKCTRCEGVKTLPLHPEALEYYTYNGDQTYTAPWKICTDCAEWDREGKKFTLSDLAVGMCMVMLFLLCFLLLFVFRSYGV